MFEVKAGERPHFAGKAVIYLIGLVVGIILLITGPLWLGIVFVVIFAVGILTMSKGREPLVDSLPVRPQGSSLTVRVRRLAQRSA